MRILAGCAVALLLGASPAAAQYFGQNKVQYRHLKFSIIETEHFDVHFYEDERAAAVDAARMAERAYARLSRVLKHEYRERQPIILWASHSEFQQNNITDVGDAGGVTDAYRHRAMLPFTGAYEDFDHVLQHELVHQFQYDVFARGRVGAGIQRLIAVQPPGWLFEGMAEYLSLGPINPLTATWLRNAALEGHLPSVEEMTYNPRVFPYRYGHALMAFIGERWGDEVIGEILHAVASSGVESGFRRALGMSLEELSEEWHYAVRREYLPEVADHTIPRTFAKLSLNERRTGGSLHVSPAVSPDGELVAYLGEGSSFFIDLWVAEVETGRVRGRLTKSAFSADLENLRYLYSTGSWSPDGRYYAIAAKSGARDDLVIFDMGRRKIHRRLEIPLHGVTTPTWSPDGRRLVFTGLDGGLSDLFVIDVDGGNLERLTRDRHADLQPAWSPDGRTIAFATDRGPDTDLDALRIGRFRIALYDLERHSIRVLDRQEGRNINPQWAPDGRSLAFISDRTGIANVFLHDLADGAEYQLTDVYTAVTGITDLSPAISWASEADRLVFSYYEGADFTYNLYWADDPRSLKREPWVPRSMPAPIASTDQPELHATADVAAGRPDSAVWDWLLPLPSPARDTTAGAERAAPPAVPSGSFYRGPGGFRASGVEPVQRPDLPPISVKDLLDSATLALPDTGSFGYRRYSGGLAPDYIAQPSIGYARDNFGRGVYGGAAIALSDLLGNRRMFVGAQVNGRIDEAQALIAYGNAARRMSWIAGYEQYPTFFYSGSFVGDSAGLPTAIYAFTRYMTRRVFAETHRPFNRFRRVEFGLRATDVGIARQTVVQVFDPANGSLFGEDVVTEGLGHDMYLQPSVAMVFDNSISLYVGPYLGRRSRLEYAPAIGQVRFHQVLVDYRRYDRLFGPFVLATRSMLFGRFGRDDDRFRVSISNPDFLRGYTFGSLRDNECQTDEAGTFTGCAALDQVIGTRFSVFNAELRFPLFRTLALGFLPVWFPPIEGAIFFDAGLAWEDGSRIVWSREPGDNPALVRQPLTSWGFSGRVNVLGFAVFRFDYTKPLTRAAGVPAYWTVSIGPTF